LGMNPPTPLRSSFQEQNQNENDPFYENSPATPAAQRQALESSTGNARPQQTSRPSSFVGTGGKARFYGDLRGSMGGLPRHEQEHEAAVEVRDAVTAKDDASVVSSLSSSDYSRTRTMESTSTASANFQIHHDADEEEDENYVTYQSTSPYPSQQTSWNGPRQTSNSTGYDLNSGYAGLGPEFGAGMGRRREVSGKIAEEGRGDEQYYGRQQESPKAAGWARFKGM
jgi:hypothetical protein